MTEASMTSTPFEDARVKSVFDDFPAPAREALLSIREWIFEVGRQSDEIGTIEESLKWGEPAYSCRSGSTIRLAWKRARPDEVAVYFHCQTKLVDTFRELYGERFSYEGSRAIWLPLNRKVPEPELRRCIELALTYHRWKKQH